ncbi:hypothetical protein AXR31_004220 [Salmonella enterica subsp. enterica serovar Braenderup]|nr:hypothetical protein [Salmonella enterica subsp. enterica serovar Braenderup]
MKTINSINKHQSRLNDSRLAPFVSMTAMKTRLCSDGNVMADAITLSESSLRCGASGAKRLPCLTA